MDKIYTEAERLDLIISSLEGGNQRRFAEKAKIIDTTLSRIRSGQLSLRAQVDKIIAAYPVVSREWLLTGIGYPGDISVDIARAYYEKVLQERNDTIRILSQELELQQEIIRELRRK